MSHSVYFEIYPLDSGELLPSFASPGSFFVFRGSREPRLTIEDDREAMFTILSQCAECIPVAGLDMFDLNQFDEKVEDDQMGELSMRRVGADVMDQAIRGIQELLQVARSSPDRLIFDHWRDRTLRRQFEMSIAKAAESTGEVSDVACISNMHGECFESLFWALKVVSNICKEAKQAGQTLFCVWYCC